MSFQDIIDSYLHKALLLSIGMVLFSLSLLLLVKAPKADRQNEKDDEESNDCPDHAWATDFGFGRVFV